MIFLAACGGGDSGLPNAVALSPDGVRHLAFSYSPDGKRVAYWSPAADSSSQYQLWVANADLSAPAKLPAKSFVNNQPAIWSRDGVRLAAVTSEYGIADIVVMTAAGGDVKRVTTGVGFEFPIAWYPDGDRLSYYASAEGGTIRSFVVSVRTGVSAPLVPGEQHPHLGSPSPDGSHVAYFVIDGPRTTIWVADSAGGNPRQLTTEGFDELVQFHEWSPDGKELLYMSSRTGRSDLWVLPIDGGKPRQLTRDVRNDFAGAWSPDGKWVAFLSDRGGQTDIWVVPAAGGVEERVTDNPVVEQAPLFWQPGSHTLAFMVRTDRTNNWALDIASGAERKLTPDSLYINWLNVSPDGQHVNYVIVRGGGIQDLATMPLAGGEARVLVSGGGTVATPHWSPDGSKIVFGSDRGGTNDVWVVDAAGGAPRQLVNWPGNETSPVWNGDGSAILFNSDRDTRLGDVWKVPTSGGEPVRVTHEGSIGALSSRAGVPDIFAAVISSRAGQLGLARVRPNGSVQALWDRYTQIRSISPSGDSVAVLAEQADGKLLSMILAANGSGGRVLSTVGTGGVSVWSNDGKFLLYRVSAGGVPDLFILNVADGTTRRLTTTPENEGGEEFTPDGKTVVFIRRQTVQRISAVDLTRLLASSK
jgi:Tol biopolymer transport system component